MGYDSAGLPRKSYYIPIGASVPDGSGPMIPTDSYFNKYIAQSVSDLNKGKSVTVFYDYQLEELKKVFGKKLQIRQLSRNKWWLCHINKKDLDSYGSNLGRRDVTKEKIMDLKYKGYNNAEIAEILQCSKCVITSRLKD